MSLFQDPQFQEHQLRDAALRSPHDPAGWARLALFLSARGDPDRAAQAVREAITHCGEQPPLLRALVDLFPDRPAHPFRLWALQRLLAVTPDAPLLHMELGLSILQAPNPGAALPHLRTAIDSGVTNLNVLLSIAAAERLFGELDRAVELYDRVLATEPTHRAAVLERWHLALSLMDWRTALRLEPTVRQIMEQPGATSVAPWFALALPGDEGGRRLRDLVRNRSSDHLPGTGLRHARPVAHARIRIGYLSCDFMQHATTSLIAGLFEKHDRSRFEVFVFSYGPRNDAPSTSRISAAAEHWHDVGHLGDRALNRLLLSSQLDVLVELKGHTSGARPEITRQRVAPIQLHYLGFPGPVGGFGIDFFVGDEITLPADAETEFGQPLLRLPRCYQINDRDRPIPVPPPRSELGVDADQIVLANFNQLWKIRPEFMRIWLEALHRQPRAVLWLLAPGAGAAGVDRSLREWATAAGFTEAVQRVRFLPRVVARDHLNRLAVADLALDQLPCSSHTTAADCFWAGVPLLTVRGRTFAGRVGASVAHAARSDEFICDDVQQYAARLFALVAQPGELAEKKTFLARERMQLPLFDTQGWVQDWEREIITLCASQQVFPRTNAG